jgi:hypothetical protein
VATRSVVIPIEVTLLLSLTDNDKDRPESYTSADILLEEEPGVLVRICNIYLTADRAWETLVMRHWKEQILDRRPPADSPAPLESDDVSCEGA